MYERDEFLRDRIRPHQPGTPRGYSPRPPSGDRCPAPPPGRHAAAATPPGPPRLPSAPLRPLPDPAWPRQPEAPPPSTWADPALAPIRSRTRPGERGWRRMVRLVTFGLVGLGRSGMQRQEAQFEATIRTVLHGNHKVAVLGKGGVGKTSVAACGRGALRSPFAARGGHRYEPRNGPDDAAENPAGRRDGDGVLRVATRRRTRQPAPVTWLADPVGNSRIARAQACKTSISAPIVESWRAQRGAQCGQREKSCRCSRAVHIQGISPPLFRRPLEPAVQAAVASCRLGRHPVVAHRVTVALGQGSQLAQRECPRPA